MAVAIYNFHFAFSIFPSSLIHLRPLDKIKNVIATVVTLYNANCSSVLCTNIGNAFLIPNCHHPTAILDPKSHPAATCSTVWYPRATRSHVRKSPSAGIPKERKKTIGLLFIEEIVLRLTAAVPAAAVPVFAAQILTNMARNPSEFACEEGIPGSALRAVDGRASFKANFKALHRTAARIEPKTHQAQIRSLRAANVVNTAALTVHLVDSLIVSKSGWCWRAAGLPSFAVEAEDEAEAVAR